MTKPKLKSFVSIEQSIPRKRGKCPRCARPGVQDGTVRVGVSRYRRDEAGKMIHHNPKSVATRNIGFCEECCVEVYQELEAVLLREGGKA